MRGVNRLITAWCVAFVITISTSISLLSPTPHRIPPRALHGCVIVCRLRLATPQLNPDVLLQTEFRNRAPSSTAPPPCGCAPSRTLAVVALASLLHERERMRSLSIDG